MFDNYIQVYPLNDSKEHKLSGNDCKCLPVINRKRKLIIHNAFDDRNTVIELLEFIAEKDKQ